MAVAWGNRRLGSPDGDAMIDARTQLQVRLDALRARAILLRRHPGITPDLLATIDQVIEHQVLINGDTAAAGSAAVIHRLDLRVDEAFVTLQQVGDAIGVDAPADDPFAGLCSIDPEHGAATVTAPDGDMICAGCLVAIDSGEVPERRQVSRMGHPVPFDALTRRAAAEDARRSAPQ